MKDVDRRAQLVVLWHLRPPDKRTDADVLAFYGDIQMVRPDLLKVGHGDPYQQLKSDLRDHITNQ